MFARPVLPVPSSSRRTPIPSAPSASELDAAERLAPLPHCGTRIDEVALMRRSGFSLRQVRYWLGELPRRAAARDGFPEPPAFIEVRAPSAQSRPIAPPLSVVLPSGLRVEIPPGFDPSSLVAVVQALSC